MTHMLRKTRAHATKTVIGASPISQHQPRPTSVVAGSLIVEFVRSAAVRLA
jgi:hypothetical protein